MWATSTFISAAPPGCVPFSAGRWLQMTTLSRILHLGWLVPAGAGAYFAVLFALGFRLRDFSRRAAS